MFYQGGCRGKDPCLRWHLRDTSVKSHGSEYTIMSNTGASSMPSLSTTIQIKTSVTSVFPLFPSICLRHESWWTPGIRLFSSSCPSPCTTPGGHSEELGGACSWHPLLFQEGIPPALQGPLSALPLEGLLLPVYLLWLFLCNAALDPSGYFSSHLQPFSTHMHP